MRDKPATHTRNVQFCICILDNIYTTIYGSVPWAPSASGKQHCRCEAGRLEHKGNAATTAADETVAIVAQCDRTHNTVRLDASCYQRRRCSRRRLSPPGPKYNLEVLYQIGPIAVPATFSNSLLSSLFVLPRDPIISSASQLWKILSHQCAISCLRPPVPLNIVQHRISLASTPARALPLNILHTNHNNDYLILETRAFTVAVIKLRNGRLPLNTVHLIFLPMCRLPFGILQASKKRRS